MSLVAHPTVALPQPIVIDNQDTLTRLIAEVKEEIFRHLKPEDHVFLMQSARLLSLRDSNPSKCIGEAGILLSDFSVPRCWRARAGIYRAESFMILGFDQFAKEQLTLAARVLETDDHLQPSDRIDRKRHEILEGLVAWNIALGKINWGITDPKRIFSMASKKEKSKHPRLITTSGKFFSAGYPSSSSLTALDLKYC